LPHAMLAKAPSTVNGKGVSFAQLGKRTRHTRTLESIARLVTYIHSIKGIWLWSLQGMNNLLCGILNASLRTSSLVL
jgi:hypothetical protein